MKVLSIKQPWASLIANGYKEYEFRTWKTKYRGEFLIHASKQIDKKSLKHFEQLNLSYPTGKIIAKATITDCVAVTEEFNNDLIKKNELIYGLTKNREGYAFKINNIKKLDSLIDINGKLGFWNYEK